MITIGLIGGIAAGKTTAAKMLAERGAVTITGDTEAHALYAPGTYGYEAIIAAFGQSVLAEDGHIDRKVLGNIIFNDSEARQLLNDIMWPLARQKFIELKTQYEEDDCKVLVLEAAVLLDAGCQDLVNEIWFVTAAESVRTERLSTRSGLSGPESEVRIKAQKSIDLHADELQGFPVIEIDSGGTMEEFEASIDKEWQRLLARLAQQGTTG